jgi:hypothetical protein
LLLLLPRMPFLLDIEVRENAQERWTDVDALPARQLYEAFEIGGSKMRHAPCVPAASRFEDRDGKACALTEC